MSVDNRQALVFAQNQDYLHLECPPGVHPSFCDDDHPSRVKCTKNAGHILVVLSGHLLG